MNDDNDRLEKLEEMLTHKKNRGSQLYWIKYNPASDFDYDVLDASEDIKWMIFEIRRLREENEHYREFLDSYRKDLSRDLGPGEDS